MHRPLSMRTTLRIDDDALRAVKRLAEARRVPMGRVASELMPKALSSAPGVHAHGGFPVFEVGPDARPITLEAVRRVTVRRLDVSRSPQRSIRGQGLRIKMLSERRERR